MSIKQTKLRRIGSRIENLRKVEVEAERAIKRAFHGIHRWIWMLYFEFTKNDLSIRAESLAYYTLFSIFPILAGVILILGIFSHFGPIDQQFQSGLKHSMEALPSDDQDRIIHFILKFRDYYSEKVTAKSVPIAGASVIALLFVSGRVFFNIESMVNAIWEAKEDRPVLIRFRNFLLCAFVLPLLYAVTVSLPSVFQHLTGTTISLWITEGLPAVLAFFSLSLLFRYGPNVKVSWRSAHIGALAALLIFWVVNFGLVFYFRFATQTLYGKAGVFPIFAFFMYVSWLIFMIGVEISYLVEQENAGTKSLKINQRLS